MTILFTEPSFVPVSGNSVVYPGAKLYFYATETSTPQNTYSEYTLTTAHANPVVADADGRFAPIYLDPSLEDYKVVLKDSSDVTIWTVDPYSAGNNTAALGTMSDMLSANTVIGTVSINGYHTAGDGGGGDFYWDTTQDKANHNGGTIIDPDITFPSDWTNSAQVTTWFTAGTGTGCWVRQTRIYFLEHFGVIKSSENHAASNYKAIRSALSFVLGSVSANTALWESIDTVPELHAGSGNIWIQGNSPFGLNLAELQALGVGNSTFRRGFGLKGAGRGSTIFTIKNTGAETWFFTDTDTTVDNTATSMKGQQYHWEGFTVRGEDLELSTARKYRVPAASTVNGFYVNTNGGGSFYTYKDLTLEGIDTCHKVRGTGNGDQASYINVYFNRVIDCCFDFSNDQSVTNTALNCAVLTYGDVIKIGEQGGGDLSWNGGSITMYPRYDVGNVTSDAYNTGNPSGVLHYDMGTSSVFPTAGAGNVMYSFNDCRFEMYGAGKHAFLSLRDDIKNFGLAYGKFNNCRFQNDYEWDSVGDVSQTRTTFKNLVYIVKQPSDVQFYECAFGEFLKFTVLDVGDSSQANASAYISVKNSSLQWDTSDSTKGMFATRFVRQIVSSDRCNVKFVSEGNYSILVAASESLTCEDAYYTAGDSGGPSAAPMIWANALPSHVVWPSTSGSNRRLYLPEGSIVTSVFVNKPAGTGTGSATYEVELRSQSGTVIYTSGSIQEENEFIAKADVSNPFKVPAAPNNYVRVQAINGNSVNVTQSAGGVFLVGYFTGQNSYTGTTPF